MAENYYPRSQSELLKSARGQLSQAEFAERMGVDRTCLCRYESEKLGAPAKVINYCLAVIATRLEVDGFEPDVASALDHARSAVRSLERLIV